MNEKVTFHEYRPVSTNFPIPDNLYENHVIY